MMLSKVEHFIMQFENYNKICNFVNTNSNHVMKIFANFCKFVSIFYILKNINGKKLNKSTNYINYFKNITQKYKNTFKKFFKKNYLM